MSVERGTVNDLVGRGINAVNMPRIVRRRRAAVYGENLVQAVEEDAKKRAMERAESKAQFPKRRRSR